MANKTHPLAGMVIICLAVFMVSSCIGIKSEIVIKKNGSSTVWVEYTVLKSLGDLGKLDGNERYPTLPAGKADFERGIKKINGAKLKTYTQKEKDNQYIYTAKLFFPSLEALAQYIDPADGAAGEQTAVTKSADGKTHARWVISKKHTRYDEDVSALLETLAAGYNFSLTVAAPAPLQARLTDAAGNALPDIAVQQINAKKAALLIPMQRVVREQDGIILELVF